MRAECARGERPPDTEDDTRLAGARVLVVNHAPDVLGATRVSSKELASPPKRRTGRKLPFRFWIVGSRRT
jgi:hypothetical protein